VAKTSHLSRPQVSATLFATQENLAGEVRILTQLTSKVLLIMPIDSVVSLCCCDQCRLGMVAGGAAARSSTGQLGPASDTFGRQHGCRPERRRESMSFQSPNKGSPMAITTSARLESPLPNGLSESLTEPSRAQP
jgi:hypothetical protein